MKRYGNLWEKIINFENLLRAAEKTFLGQKRKKAVAEFYFHLEPELLKLQDELRTGTYRPRPFRVFWVFEPKPRQICAGEVRDRVVHHAICNILDPIFEKRLIYDTFACRRGKGTHAAVERVQKFSRRWKYYLQGDIKHYFATVDHNVLKVLLRRMIKDKKLLCLFDVILDQPVPNSPSGKGMPIGNLTSQYFANFYLSELDYLVKEKLRVRGYVRYMDDFVIFGHAADELQQIKDSVEKYLVEKLCLNLKPKATVIAPTQSGISFLGFRVFPGVVRLQRKKWKRFKKRVRILEKDFLSGKIKIEEVALSVQSMIGHLQHADTKRLRQQFFSESLIDG